MSSYFFSLLSDDAVLDWQAETDLLRFDDRSISASSLRIRSSADGRSPDPGRNPCTGCT